MKIKEIAIIVIALGVWMLLFNMCGNIKRAMTSPEERYALMQHLIKQGKYPASIDIDKFISEKVREGYVISSGLMGLGLILVIGGIMLISKRTNIRTSTKEIAVHFLYWLVFICAVGFVMSGFGSYLSGCTIDWIYLFLVPALTGFYAGYLYLYTYFAEKEWKVFFGALILTSALGVTLSSFHLTVWGSFLSGNFSTLINFHFADVLSYGFYAFLAFLHVFISLMTKKLQIRL